MLHTLIIYIFKPMGILLFLQKTQEFPEKSNNALNNILFCEVMAAYMRRVRWNEFWMGGGRKFQAVSLGPNYFFLSSLSHLSILNHPGANQILHHGHIIHHNSVYLAGISTTRPINQSAANEFK